MQRSPPPEAFSSALRTSHWSAHSHGSTVEVHDPPEHLQEVKKLLSLDGFCVGGPREASRYLGAQESDAVPSPHAHTVDVEKGECLTSVKLYTIKMVVPNCG